jgi:hypothetical protein
MEPAPDESLCGSLWVSSQGIENAPFTIRFVPNGAKEVSRSGHTVKDVTALQDFLQSLRLTEGAIETLLQGLKASQGYELRNVPASKAFLRTHHLL